MENDKRKILKCLRDLQPIAAGIANVETLPTRRGKIVRHDLDACLTKTFFRLAQIVDCITNVSLAEMLAGTIFNREMKLDGAKLIPRAAAAARRFGLRHFRHSHDDAVKVFRLGFKRSRRSDVDVMNRGL